MFKHVKSTMMETKITPFKKKILTTYAHFYNKMKHVRGNIPVYTSSNLHIF